MSKLREFLHSPLPMNIIYWAFIGLMAVMVHPAVLAVLLFLPGFSSSPEVEVEKDDLVVRVRGNREMSRDDIRAAIEEARQ